MYEIGDKVRFTPAAFSAEIVLIPEKDGKRTPPREVTGTIVYINAPHRYYTAAFEVNGYRLLESFKF